MRLVSSFSAAALVLGLCAVPASAQVAGLPVNYSPVGTGVTVHGDFGRGLNEASGKLNSFGGGVTLGMPMFQIGAAVSYYGVGGDTPIEEISFGGHAAYKVSLPPTAPVSLAIAAGVGTVSIGGTSVLFVPAGVTLGIKVPSSSVNVLPWVSPQFRLARASGETESDFGVSGGLNVTLPAGLGFNVLGDYNNADEAFTLGAGLSYGIRVPSLSGGM